MSSVEKLYICPDCGLAKTDMGNLRKHYAFTENEGHEGTLPNIEDELETLEGYDPDAFGHIYVLKLQYEEKFYWYVGGSVNLMERLRHHISGEGADVPAPIEVNGVMIHSYEETFPVEEIEEVEPIYVPDNMNPPDRKVVNAYERRKFMELTKEKDHYRIIGGR